LSAFAEMPRYRSNENLTSSAVTGSPLWNMKGTGVASSGLQTASTLFFALDPHDASLLISSES